LSLSDPEELLGIQLVVVEMEGQLNNMAYKRLRKELEQMNGSSDPFIQLACVGEEDLTHWVRRSGLRAMRYDTWVESV